MRLTDWMLQNSEKIQLKADKYIWVNEWIPGYFDYGVIIKILGEEYSGRGIDKSEEIAFEKASAEALERAVVGMAHLNMPWGTAAYPTRKGAQKKAYYELLAIDRVFCHHFCREKLKETLFTDLNSLFPIESTKNTLLKNNIDLHLYELRATKDAKIVCAIAWGNKYLNFNGLIAGFGADESLEHAKLHAVVECLRTAVVALCTHYLPEKPIEELKKRGEPLWHFWMAQTPQVSDYVKKELIPNRDQNTLLQSEPVTFEDVHFDELKFPLDMFPDLPLYFFQAASEKLIVPQFGPFVPDDRTIKRLKEFSNFNIDNVPQAPHFYG